MKFIKLVAVFICSLGLMACGSSLGTETLVVTPPASALTMSFTPTKAFRFTWVAATGATYYNLKEAATVGSGYTLVKKTTATSFDHVVPLYARLNAKYILESCSDTACSTSTAIFTSTELAAMSSSIGLIRATTPVKDNMFGWNISLSSDGSTLAVAAQQATVDTKAKAGEVSIFKQSVSGTDWVHQQTIKASDGVASDEFGHRVSLSADGNVLAVSTLLDDSKTGSVYIFNRAGTTWAEKKKLRASDAAIGNYFGESLSLSADGGTLAVGQFDNDSAVHKGSVYVFTGSGASWTEQYIATAKTDAGNPDATAGDQFGRSISLSSDGNILAVGAPFEEATGTTNNKGAVYIFNRTGTSWSQKKKLTASTRGNGDQFGSSLSLSNDGASLAVGAPGEDGTSPVISNSGSVYFFNGSGATWTENAILRADNAGVGDGFGISVSLNSDGTILAVSAPMEDSISTVMNTAGTDTANFNSGAVYVFTGSVATWAQQAYLKASNAGLEDEFGYNLSLSSDGTVLAVGVYEEDFSGSITESGAVYLY